MNITVKYFGLLTDLTQTNEEQFLLDDIVLSIFQLKDVIEVKYPSLSKTKFAIALNQTIVNKDEILNNNDEVAFLPPFAGG